MSAGTSQGRADQQEFGGGGWQVDGDVAHVAGEGRSGRGGCRAEKEPEVGAQLGPERGETLGARAQLEQLVEAQQDSCGVGGAACQPRSGWDPLGDRDVHGQRAADASFEDPQGPQCQVVPRLPVDRRGARRVIGPADREMIQVR